MRSSLLVGLLTATILVASTQALPRVRTYRGKSRYETMYMEPEPIPNFPNPRSDPDFYSHRYTEEYHRQGYEDVRPKWAQYLHNVFQGSLNDLGANLISNFKVLSPYFASEDKLGLEDNHFTFNKNGDEGFPVVKPDQHRFDLEQNNISIFSLPKSSGFDYKTHKVRGVNIGNWLLFELWMDSKLSAALNDHAINAPHPNAIVDEWTAGQYSDYKWAKQVLEKHFDTWITEKDFEEIKSAGLNHVRIPFPYWAFAEAKGSKAPYLTLNRFHKLIEACGWAKKHGLKVWIDIHSVPGSQNGYDNSGRTGGIHWASEPEYYKRTQYTFNRLASLFSQSEWKGTVTSIEAVNEPAANRDQGVSSLIKEYYPWARNAAAHPPNTTRTTHLLMTMHDGFLGPLHWKDFFTGKAANRVLLDTHPYFVYSDQEKTMGDKGRIKEVCDMENTMTNSQKNYPTIAGEWSVNGPNGDKASDRDLTRGPVDFPDGPHYPYSKRYMAFMARNYAVQTFTFEKGSGWMFWAWKNRNNRDWSYKTGLKYGWIPKIKSKKPWSQFGDDPCEEFR